MLKSTKFLFGFLAAISLLFLLSSADGNIKSRLKSLKKSKVKIDKMVKKSPESMKYFCKTKGMDKPFAVKAKNYWPAESNIEMSFALLYDKKGKLIYAYEEPFAPLGEYTINHCYYFDKDGKTAIYEYYCGFFGSVCAGNSIAKETRTQYLTTQKIIAEDYSLLSEDGKKLDSLKCEFPYREGGYKFSNSVVEFKRKNGLD
ncbi:MAG: hypothetical protein NTX03_06410 [Bacteroidetes bacterium]|nr:hypothetical protein [Bacteroidota bacterium]